MSSRLRVRLIFLWIAASLVLAANIAYAVYVLSVPHDGVSTGIFNFTSEGVEVARILPGGTDAVHKGDFVTHVNGVSVDELLASGGRRQATPLDVNAPVTYTLSRPVDPNELDGAQELLTVTTEPGQLKPFGVLLRAPTTPLFGLTFLVVAFLVFSRRQRDSSAQLFWLLSLNVLTLGINDPFDYQVISLVRPPVFWWHIAARDMIISGVGMAALLTFTMIFPRRFKFVERSGRWLFALVAASALAAPWLGMLLATPGLPTILMVGTIELVVLFVGILGAVLFVAANFFVTKDPIQRAQLGWLTWGSAVGLLPVLVAFLGPLLLGFEPLLLFDVVGVTLLVIPVALGISIARYRLWDIEVVVNRSIVYSIVVVLLGIVYLFVVTGLQRLLANLTGVASGAAAVTSTALIAGLFSPVRNGVQVFVNRTLFAEQNAARERLAYFGREVQNTIDLPLLLDQLLSHVCVPLDTRTGHVLLQLDEKGPYRTVATYGDPDMVIIIRPDDALIGDLQRGRVMVSPGKGALEGVSVAVPMIAFGELVGVMALGERRVQHDYNADDREALRGMADQAALAIRVTKLQADLVNIERLSALGSAASAIVHDIKNQMAAAGGYAGLLTRPDLNSEQRVQYGEALMRSIDGFSLMANEILDLARGESHVNIKPILVGDLLEKIQPLLERMCEQANIDLQVNLEYDGEVSLDAARMQRVLFNLCDNAHDALLEVNPSEGRRIVLSCELEERWVVFQVSDNGPGIPPMLGDTLFDPFITAEKSEGTGLGLAVAKNVVEAHGGQLSHDGSVSVGATFVLKLPLILAPEVYAAVNA